MQIIWRGLVNNPTVPGLFSSCHWESQMKLSVLPACFYLTRWIWPNKRRNPRMVSRSFTWRLLALLQHTGQLFEWPDDFWLGGPPSSWATEICSFTCSFKLITIIIAVSIKIAMGIGNWAFRYREQGSDLPEWPPNNSFLVLNSQCAKQPLLKQLYTLIIVP